VFKTYDKKEKPSKEEPNLESKLKDLLGVPIQSKIKSKFLIIKTSSETESVGSTRYSYDYSS